ncbi:MAG TPA: F0F1 ATP synthase subunit alpha [Candidatus Levybacteria bacterium]|nr:F0F1 ATP synthase subunit alpha [Candidatus Levybacteria bacterium]
MKPEELIKQLEQRLAKIDSTPGAENVGTVLAVGDGIVTLSGLSRVGYGEEVEFQTGSRGLAMGIEQDTVSVVLLSDDAQNIIEGMSAKTTGRVLGISVSEDLLGRVIDPMGNPLDGKELKVKKGEFYPLEKIAPGVIERQSVDTPLKTGIKPIDTLTPIGRGQRQLIIGDRGTGKTAIAIDTIINQKKKDLGLQQVICIYCPIGQKRGNIAQTVALLQDNDAIDYSIVVAASASDPAPLQFLAPYAATAIAEYFMDRGQDVLVVYDDLSKHAWSYRQVSLLLRRPAGREAYPGDIFYLHSRLLERSARMSKEKGGGSITSFPIIETQAGDVSAYIPTNVISITDGQIFLETDLFNSGTRPAINVGISVSRVGGAAQTKAMKQVAGPVRIELAQYRSMAAFAQFGTDLDEETAKQIERGKRVSAIMNQPQYSPFDEVSEIVSTYAATSGLIDDVPVERVSEFETKLLEHLKVSNKKLLETVGNGEKMDDKTLEALQKAITDFKKGFLK